MLAKLKNGSQMKEIGRYETTVDKKLDRRQRRVFKSKSDKTSSSEDRHLPTLIIEPSSDGEELESTFLNQKWILPDKPRSFSYSNYESSLKDNLRSDSFDEIGTQSKYRRNRFRRLGKSMDIPKPCIHCILLEEINSSYSVQSPEEDSRVSDPESKFSESESPSLNFGEDNRENNTVFENLSHSLTNSENFVHFLQVPEQKDIDNVNSKPRSQSIDQIISYFSLDKQNLSVEWIMTNSNKPRAVSIDFNISFRTKKSNKQGSNIPERPSILIGDNVGGQSAENIHFLVKTTPDWSIDSKNKVHHWVDTNLSGDLCYLNEQDCEKTGAKKKCSVCKVIIHQLCISKLDFQCRPTFREAGVRDYRDEKKKEDILKHHWVHRKRQDGKCKQCGKSFQSKFSINSKDILSVQCSWCKSPYHNKSTCFSKSLLTEECKRGQHFDSIIPPSWIIKMATKNNFKSSVRKSRSPDSVSRCILKNESIAKPTQINIDSISDSNMSVNDDNLTQHSSMTKSISFQSTTGLINNIPFVIKPIPNSPPTKPLLIFLNPKSGGNAGAKLMRKFQWLLNPRQVFDITDGGPRLGLELFGKISNLRILVCGGDGTVGWVMSEIDNLNIVPSPPIAILPLGTGNDLARTTNWGSGYTDEPLSKIISCVEEGTIKPLDRWTLTSSVISLSKRVLSKDELCAQKDSGLAFNSYLSDPTGLSATSKLPLNVFTNYFSLGADAATALEFHESREANPEKFNSRLKNKIFYAGIGGKDVLKRSWKDLCDYVSLVCDGIDYTQRIKEMKPHLLLFLNIQRYSGGTLPWGNPSAGFGPQSFNDGKVEVVGLTAASLATLQVGGHADRICQCQSAVVRTSKTIPIQVDGEPCRLLPSEIVISHHSSAQIILKPKRRISVPILSDFEEDVNQDYHQYLKLSVFVIPLLDYEENVMDRCRVMEAARFFGMLTEQGGSNLATVRENILQMTSDMGMLDKSFIFLDSTTTERFFRIAKDKEENHYLMDICFDDLFVLDPKLPSNLLLTESPTAQMIGIHLSMDSIGDEINGHVSNNSDTNMPDNVFNESDVQDNDCHYDLNTNLTECEKEIIQSMELQDSEQKPLRKYKNMEDLNNRFIEACKSMNVGNVQKYIFDGADILSVDHDGLTGLHHAVIHGNIAVVHYLVNDDSGNLLEMKDFINGQTALHKASAAGLQSICSLLISVGASLLVKDNSDKTPSQLSNDPQLMQLLQSKSSSISNH